MSMIWSKLSVSLRRQILRERRATSSYHRSHRVINSSSRNAVGRSTRFFSQRPNELQRPVVLQAAAAVNNDDLEGSPEESTWLIPRKGTGFDNFFPKNKKNQNESDVEKDSNEKEATEKDGSEKEPSGVTPEEERKWSNGFGNFNSSDKKKGGGENKGGSGLPPPPFGPAGLVAGALLLLMTYIQLRSDEDPSLGGDSSNNREINWNDFCNHLLETGQVEKVVVTNNRTTAKVFLKRGSPGLPHYQNRRFRYADRRQQAGSSDSTHNNPMFDGGANMSDGFSSSEFSSSATSLRSKKQPQIVYRFAIGSVDAFEKKLEEAQRVVGMKKSQEIPVQYTSDTSLSSEVMGVIPSLFFIGAVFYFTRFAASSMGGGGAGGRGGGGMGGIFQIGKSTHKKIAKEDVKVDFSNVAGCDEAKKEIMEFVDFLKEPDRFTKLGAKIPKGALLCGPPGTGKTLLAKAVAGESGVPFFTISGSDFIEMFVGVGPSRVRDLFKEARENAPCIIFIDEIDAVGRQRGRGGVGGNDERENTLNQLLVEMDGFDTTSGVVVLAGTNRVDILDQALTRPGRFDRQITVDKPDLKGRKDIFKVHLEGITLKDSMDDVAGRLAGLTPGFAGADIANICNEAAIVAARREAETVSMDDFEKATDRIIGGLESNKIISKEEREIVAYHEAGHAVAGWFLEHADPLLKVTIIPRTSGALGFAQYLPKEVFLQTNDQIMDIVCMALAGRAAEEVFFGGVTTGASDDLRRVTDLVYQTIQVYGMNERLGQLAFPKDPNAMWDERPYSEKTAKAMDEEAKQIVDEAYQRTVDLIRERKEKVEQVAKLLLEKETITHDDVFELIGPRPYEGNAEYDEFVRRYKVKDDGSDTKETKSEEDDKAVDPDTETEAVKPGLV